MAYGQTMVFRCTRSWGDTPSYDGEGLRPKILHDVACKGALTSDAQMHGPFDATRSSVTIVTPPLTSSAASTITMTTAHHFKPAHQPIKEYYAALESYRAHDVTDELAVKTAFQRHRDVVFKATQ